VTALETMEAKTDFAALLPVARQHLHWLFGESEAVGPDVLADQPALRVNVTLRSRGEVRGSMSGQGVSLREQLLDAVYRASKDTRFTGSLVKSDLQETSLEVWLQIGAQIIPLQQRDKADVVRLGEEGVEVRLGSASAYYKPSVALTSRFETPQEMFSELCKKANLPEDTWQRFDCVLHKTLWVHFCETNLGTPIQLYALRPNKPLTITKATMVEWAALCANYFINNQYSDGSFCYQYRPFKNTAKRKPTNPVRASGCAYAMAEAASSTHLESDPEIIKCASRAIEAVLQRIAPLNSGGSYIKDDSSGSPQGKLGTTALLLLALLTSRFNTRYAREIDALLEAVKGAQQDDGLFKCVFGADDGSNSQINFFPGQALLALVVRAGQGDKSCKAYYQKAFAPYREHFRKSPSTAFVGWQVDVWTRAALLDSNHEYASFVFEQIDWMLRLQVGDNPQRLESGGFTANHKPPYYSSNVYTEAVARAADLAYRLGDVRWPRYRAALQAGLRFCSRLRLTEEQSVFFPNPRRAVGGMATTLSDFEVRSDVVQHSITLALAVLDRPALLESDDIRTSW
jgi:AMMECR1 domain-containing protein